MAGKKGRSWTSEERFLAELNKMDRQERATFLLLYVKCWRRAVLSGKIKGRIGGAMLRERERIKQDNQRKVN